MNVIWVQKALGPYVLNVSERDENPSFTVVRHPIYRLVSAWLEKLGPMEPGHSERDKALQFVGFFCLFLFLFLLLVIKENFWNENCKIGSSQTS